MKQPSCHGKGTISYPNELKAAIWGDFEKKKKKKKKKNPKKKKKNKKMPPYFG
jgi:hypothetical protein